MYQMTFADVQPAAAKRMSNQHKQLLALLQPGKLVSNSELAQVSLRYGARLHELRKMGYSIKTHPSNAEDGLTYYTRKED